MFIKNTIKNKVEAYKEKTIKTANDTVEALFKLVVICLILFTLIWISVFLYVVFYHAYVPSLEHVKPVNLQYSPCDDFKKGICSFPEAHIQLTKSVHILMVGQPYKIALVLEMPESPANKELGMFMVCGRLVSKDSSVVANSCRSAMLKYHSTLVRILSTLFFAPLYIFDTLDEKQSVIVELFPNFEEDQNYPVTDVYITVQSYFTEIYSSKLHITAQMRGLRYFMYNWPVLSAGLGISLIILIIMFIATLSWWQLYGPYREYGRKVSYKRSGLSPQLYTDSDDDSVAVEELSDDTADDAQSEERTELKKAEAEECKDEDISSKPSGSTDEFITELKTLEESSDV